VSIALPVFLVRCVYLCMQHWRVGGLCPMCPAQHAEWQLRLQHNTIQYMHT
jgi:hypothetical protein